MPLKPDQITSRRRFLQFLASSPLLASGGASAVAQALSAPSKLSDPMIWAPRDLENLIVSPKGGGCRQEARNNAGSARSSQP
jgi:hypothetical protein